MIDADDLADTANDVRPLRHEVFWTGVVISEYRHGRSLYLALRKRLRQPGATFVRHVRAAQQNSPQSF